MNYFELKEKKLKELRKQKGYKSAKEVSSNKLFYQVFFAVLLVAILLLCNVFYKNPSLREKYLNPILHSKPVSMTVSYFKNLDLKESFDAFFKKDTFKDATTTNEKTNESTDTSITPTNENDNFTASSEDLTGYSNEKI